MIILMPSTVQYSQPLLFNNCCNCTVESYKRNESQSCKFFSAPFPNDPNYVDTTTNAYQILVTVIEGPVDYGNGELARISCQTQTPATMSLIIFP